MESLESHSYQYLYVSQNNAKSNKQQAILKNIAEKENANQHCHHCQVPNVIDICHTAACAQACPPQIPCCQQAATTRRFTAAPATQQVSGPLVASPQSYVKYGEVQCALAHVQHSNYLAVRQKIPKESQANIGSHWFWDKQHNYQI